MRIIVNGRKMEWAKTDISYSKVAAELQRQEAEGTLILGKSISVYDGIISTQLTHEP